VLFFILFLHGKDNFFKIYFSYNLEVRANLTVKA